jgi:cytidylate kinase
MKMQIHDEPRIVAAAERQMRAWARSEEIAAYGLEEAVWRRLTQCGRTYIAMTRESGTNAPEIARLCGQKLGWEILDKTLLDRVAERLREPRTMLDAVDETRSSWIYDVLGTWLDDQLVTHDKYVAYLGRVIRAAGRHGKVVFVGRGAQFLLPREKGLTVRLVASEKYRIQTIMERESFGEAEARRFMIKTDGGRQAFVAQFFRRDVTDPHLYDLVLNVERLGAAAVVDQIVVALCR